jgi:hypothetical protein
MELTTMAPSPDCGAARLHPGYEPCCFSKYSSANFRGAAHQRAQRPRTEAASVVGSNGLAITSMAPSDLK